MMELSLGFMIPIQSLLPIRVGAKQRLSVLTAFLASSFLCSPAANKHADQADTCSNPDIHLYLLGDLSKVSCLLKPQLFHL